MSTSNWKSRVKNVVTKAAEETKPNVLLQTIDEFVQTIDESPWMHAELVQGSAPSIHSIVVMPKYRRKERETLLSFWVTPYSISVVGNETSRDIYTKDQLETFFARYAEGSELPALAAKYEQKCNEPVAAMLRAGRSMLHERGARPVRVPSAEQMKLALAAQSGQPELALKVLIEPGRQLATETEYQMLESAGFGLVLSEDPKHEDGALTLRGRPVHVEKREAPFPLSENSGSCFLGVTVGGMGFVLTADEASQLIAKNSRSREVLFPFLNGEELNTTCTFSPSRYIIDFQEWPLSRAQAPVKYEGPVAEDFPEALLHVEATVKFQRAASSARAAKVPWWHFLRRRTEDRRLATPLKRVLVRAVMSKHHAFTFIPSDYLVNNTVVVFRFEQAAYFAALQSFAHAAWTEHFASSMHGFLRYAPQDSFVTFPMPSWSDRLEATGEKYFASRQNLMASRLEGLTKTYNRLHDHQEADPEIRSLRELHTKLDHEVLAGYQWDDIDLQHGFRETSSGLRFTVSAQAEREILERLLELNHQRFAEETEQVG